MLQGLRNRILDFLPTKIVCKIEFDTQTFTECNERPVEFAFIFKSIGKLYPKKILDVGTGKTALPHLMRNCGPIVWAMDNIIDYWPSGMSNRHYHVLDRDITSKEKLKNDGKFDLITCVSVLEHIVDHNKAVQNMFHLLNEGGHLIITCPYTENKYCEDVYPLPESNAFGKNIPFVCQSYSKENLDYWLKENGGEVVIQEYWQCWSGELWSTGERIIPPIEVSSDEKHQLTCLLIKKRHNN